MDTNQAQNYKEKTEAIFVCKMESEKLNYCIKIFACGVHLFTYIPFVAKFIHGVFRICVVRWGLFFFHTLGNVWK